MNRQPAPDLGYRPLKARHRQLREGFPPALNLRLHRALSWLGRAERAEDLDGRFIFLWIAFNAAYAQVIDERQGLSEQAAFMGFLERLVQLDVARKIDHMVWQEFSQSIRLLLDNPYVFPGFWDYHAGRINEAATVKKILDHIGESSQPPRIAPARGPPLWEAAAGAEQAGNDPQWDSSAQPAPETEFDQRIAW